MNVTQMVTLSGEVENVNRKSLLENTSCDKVTDDVLYVAL